MKASDLSDSRTDLLSYVDGAKRGEKKKGGRIRERANGRTKERSSYLGPRCDATSIRIDSGRQLRGDFQTQRERHTHVDDEWRGVVSAESADYAERADSESLNG